MSFKYQPQWEGPLSGRSFERQTEDAINAVLGSTGAEASDDVPLAASGVGASGTSEQWSRGDHVHPAQEDVPGNAATASRLATPRQIRLSGDASGSAMFDGSAAADIFVYIPLATQVSAGRLSSADKAKLDGIEANATKVIVDAALSSTSENPVQNKAVESALAALSARVAYLEDWLGMFKV